MSIQIEEGKYYKTRQGHKIGPMHAKRIDTEWPWRADNGTSTYRSNGTASESKNVDLPWDIIAEWTEESAPVTDTHAVETVEGPQIADTPEWAKGVEAEASVEYAVGERDYSSDITAEGVAEIRRRAAPYIDNADLVQIDPVDIKTTIADEAKRIVSGARRSAYGKPEQNFERIARFWDAYFKNTGRDISITAADVSPMMVLMKLARLAESPQHRDSIVDGVGYFLTMAEVNATKD